MRGKSEIVLLIQSEPRKNTLHLPLTEISKGYFLVETADSLENARQRLSQGGICAILVDLFLSDSHGLETFHALHRIAPQTTIIILCDIQHENLAKLAIAAGAQDYMLVDKMPGDSLLQTLHDVLERKKSELAHFNETEHAQITLQSIGDGVISTDIHGDITYMNAAAERMTGWQLIEAKGMPFSQIFNIVDSVTRIPLRNAINLAITENKTVGLSTDSVLLRRDGSEIFIEDSTSPIRTATGRVTGAVIVFRDVTEVRNTVQKMAHLAQHDYLTGLPNRLLLHDRLNQTISHARRRQQKMAVLFIDVDRFKHINDSLGHLIGDKLLQSITQRFSVCLRDSDTVSRLGGDEFVVLLANTENSEAAAHSAQKILAAQTEAHHILKHELKITLSIGISMYPEDGKTAETLLRNADAAMYHAKEKGRNNFQFFKQDMNENARKRQNLENSLREALLRQEFVLYYQPKVNLESGVITGVEALLRWRHPVRGLLSPKHFVGIAEESGLIIGIGQWMMREACWQTQYWQDAGLLPTPIAVNVSAAEFHREDFVTNVRNILSETGLDPHYLEIELTEGILIEDIESSMAILNSLKAMGVQLAIDNFGSGYSSLSYLRHLPINTLKIDQTFVQEITTHAIDASVVSAVIGIGKSLKLRVSAKGIENRKQLAFLKARDCEEGQGYLFSGPVNADTFAEMLGAVTSKYLVN